MKYKSISNTKNNLSSLLRHVQLGETIVITDRGIPVARLEPVQARSDSVRVQALIERGIVRQPARPSSEPLPAPLPVRAGGSLVEAILEEREEGR